MFNFKAPLNSKRGTFSMQIDEKIEIYMKSDKMVIGSLEIRF